MTFSLFRLFTLFLTFFQNRPKIEIFLQAGFWILREIWKLAIGIFKMWKFIVRFVKFIFWILAEISKIGNEIDDSQQKFTKIMENVWKSIMSFIKPKREKKNRNFYKNRSRRSQNRNFKTKMDYLKPTGFPKPDEENVEIGRSGKKGKNIFIY